MRKRLTATEYIEGILAFDISILSRAITLVESRLTSDRLLAKEILQALLPHTGKSLRVGITGVPGVGKSTFIESFGSFLIEKVQKKVAVLAIDPSSQRSGGSILGDKTRMQVLSQNPNAYIRPSAAGDSLGGVSNKTRETLLLCEAAGFEVILIETVGVGQSETAVKEMSDFFLLLMLAGAGDELQGIKRGIMEMADLVVINKADGENQLRAEQARADYARALHLFPPHQGSWIPEALTCSALEKSNLESIWQHIQNYQTLTQNNGFWHINRQNQNLQWFKATINEELQRHFYQNESIRNSLEIVEEQVRAGKTPPMLAAETLLRKYFE
ncbi:methylmalonyl Co-A mutase-associated GTPase MeaB [Hugenholtzia roseola]|uniref:methylmalonyl Co-A mutase-associated GTPase MeaB n=1 Tax=Hugenholtzia roseola TaxID=1002 RepID=UPI0003FF5512|nr:methylmalonyl Co-A mutase-associated GTPase MeaB [Hugenholtzia roseola]